MYVWFLSENALTMYTCSFFSATSEDVKREAMIMMSLQHQNTPFPLGISTEPISQLLVMSYYDIMTLMIMQLQCTVPCIASHCILHNQFGAA